jgi:hypothetical protein
MTVDREWESYMVYATSGVKEDEERKREGPKGMKADSDK